MTRETMERRIADIENHNRAVSGSSQLPSRMEFEEIKKLIAENKAAIILVQADNRALGEKVIDTKNSIAVVIHDIEGNGIKGLLQRMDEGEAKALLVADAPEDIAKLFAAVADINTKKAEEKQAAHDELYYTPKEQRERKQKSAESVKGWVFGGIALVISVVMFILFLLKR